MDLDFIDHEEVVSTDDLPAPPPLTTAPPSAHVSAFFQSDCISTALQNDPSLHRSALSCLTASKSTGTVTAYSRELRRIEEFCSARSLPYPHLTTETLAQYILHLDSSDTSFSIIASVKPAVDFLCRTMDVGSLFTPCLSLILDGARRRASRRKPPVKKAAQLLASDISLVLDKFFLPHIDSPHLIHLVRLRTILRIVLVYHTACRFDCYRRLRACHLELQGPNIYVHFPSAKNDQHHQGRRSAIVASPSVYCPVRIITSCFSVLGLRFGSAAADPSFLNFQARKTPQRLVPIFSRSLSYSEATANLRSLLAASGVHVPVTDKSVKMLSVTSAFASGASCESVMHLGRWRTPSIPLHYKLNSDSFKETVSAIVPAFTATSQ